MKQQTYHTKFYSFAVRLAEPIIRRRFGYSFDPELRSLQGPFLMVSNHNTDLDPVLIGTASGEQLSFVASEHVMHKGVLSRLLARLFDIITITKGKTAVKTTKDMIVRLKNGRSVLIFPEGNRSFNGITMPVDASCGKIAKIAGVPLVTVRIEGGYLTQPRWGKGFRRGKIRVRYVNSYPAEQLHEWKDDEVASHINADLYENAFETQKTERVEYKGSALAKGLETTLFMCPRCGKIGTMHSDDSAIFCAECGFLAEFNGYGELSGEDDCPESIAAWDEWQRSALSKADVSGFSDQVDIFEVGEDHSQKLVYSGKFEMPENIEGMAIYSRNVLVMHVGGRHLEVRGGEDFSALKYLYIFNGR